VAVQLHVLVRSMEQLEAVLAAGVNRIDCDFENPKRYADAVDRVRSASTLDGCHREIWVAPPRIFKPGEGWILDMVERVPADGILVRNADHLEIFRERRCRGDFSLNVANAWSAAFFIQDCGLERVTISYDLNARQVMDLLQTAPPMWFEITLHQHMPLFHMEHCVFCAFLSKGKDYRDCGRPCDKREVRLRDRVGQEHLLRADAGCRNTVFQGKAQTGADHAPAFLGLGARFFRVEFVGETADEVSRTVSAYAALLRGERKAADLWRELNVIQQLGVTRGTLE
jgi:putative protease